MAQESPTSIIAANNRAVGLLQQGQHISALNLFRSTLDAARSSIEKAESFGKPKHEKCLPISVPIDSEGITTDGDASPHNSFCFYSRVFQLAPVAGNPSDLYYMNELSTVLLYNMAVTLHHKGLRSGNRSTSFLLKALAIYKMILSLLEEETKAEGSHAIRYPELKVVLMAVYSNMGHLYGHFFDRVEAVEYRGRLQSALAVAPELRTSLAADEYVIFFLNATSPTKLAWAPAA